MRDIDFIAKRYSVLPSEVIKLDIEDLQFCLLAANIAMEDEAAQARKRSRGAKRG